MTATVTVTVRGKFATDGGNLYDAVLDPKIASRFLFRTPNGTVMRSESDPRVGGTYTIVERRDGRDVLHTGEYLELVRPSRIVFTMLVPEASSESSTVAMDIVPAGEGCEVILTHTGVPEAYAESTRQGWEQIMVRAQKALET